MKRDDISQTTPSGGAGFAATLALGMGIVLGAGLFSVVLWRAGWIAAPTPAAEPVSASPGMDALNAYRCAPAETKRIVLRGAEDGFSPAGREGVDPGAAREHLLGLLGSSGTLGVDRAYDDMSMDAMLIDRAEVPRRTAHGLFVIRLREQASLKNDSLTLGDLTTFRQTQNSWSDQLNRLSELPGWTVNGEVMSARLRDIRFRDRNFQDGRPMPRDYGSLLDFINQAPESADGAGETTSVGIAVIEDTAVDFAGFATCTGPKAHRGMTMSVSNFPVPLGDGSSLLLMECVSANGDTQDTRSCNTYFGDRSCAASFPLACFRDEREPVDPSLLDEARLLWSGGTVQLTEPVAGTSLATRGEAQALCRARFGADWRVLDYQDGSNHRTILARGRSDATRAWVDARLEPYGSCWPREADYDDLAVKGAVR